MQHVAFAFVSTLVITTTGCAVDELETGETEAAAGNIGISSSTSHTSIDYLGVCPSVSTIDLDICQSLQKDLIASMRASMAKECPQGTQDETWTWAACTVTCNQRFSVVAKRYFHSYTHTKSGSVSFSCKQAPAPQPQPAPPVEKGELEEAFDLAQ